jgi:hypothetical protein
LKKHTHHRHKENIIAPEHARPTPPEHTKTAATKAANKAERTPKRPHRETIHEILTAARHEPTPTGAAADFEAHRPIGIGAYLRGDVDLSDD